MIGGLRARLAYWAVVILAIAACSIPVGACIAMEVTFLPGAGEGGPGLLLEGEIVPGDTDRIVPMLMRIYEQGGSPRLILNSPGGNIVDADKLALLIRKAAIPVTVMSGRMCASACFLLFAASPIRSASTQARIGVHSASLFGEENLVSLSLTTIMAREAAEFGVPPDIRGRMVSTRPSEMAWLTTRELKEMDVHLLESSPGEPPADSTPSADQPDDTSQPEPPIPSPAPSVVAASPDQVPEILLYRPSEIETGIPPGPSIAAIRPAATPVLVPAHNRARTTDFQLGSSTTTLLYRPGY